jgi:hypothetical protein
MNKKFALCVVSLLSALYLEAAVVSKPLFAAQVVTAGTTNTSSIISLGQLSGLEGNFALQLTVTGGGTVDLKYEVSVDGTNFVEGGTVFDDFAVTSGPGANGKDVKEFYPETSLYIRFKVIAATSNMTVTAIAAIQ